MAKSKKTSDAFDMADDIRKEVAAESEESKDPSKSGGFRVAPYVIDLGLQKN